MPSASWCIPFFVVRPLRRGRPANQGSRPSDGVDAASGGTGKCHYGGTNAPQEEGASTMKKIGMIGVDLGKRSFQLHGVREDGSAAFRRKVSRDGFLEAMSKHGTCKVAMEGCGGAHHWSRGLRSMGFEVRLVPPAYVKPFVKRQKNDAADAEAVCEAASRPSMRFVAVKSAEQQAEGMLFRTRDLLAKQLNPWSTSLNFDVDRHAS